MTEQEARQSSANIAAYLRGEAAARKKKIVRPGILDETAPSDPAKAAQWTAARAEAHEAYISNLLQAEAGALTVAQQTELAAAIKEFRG